MCSKNTLYKTRDCIKCKRKYMRLSEIEEEMDLIMLALSNIADQPGTYAAFKMLGGITDATNPLTQIARVECRLSRSTTARV